MINTIKPRSISREPNDEKMKTGPIVQPRVRKSNISHKSSSIIQSPTKKPTNPVFVRPTCKSQTLINLNQERNIQSNPSIKNSFSLSNIIPLEPLSPTTTTKKRTKSHHKRSCSTDISWSPHIVNQNDEIRHKKSVLFDSNQEEKILNQSIYCKNKDIQLSPICDFSEAC